MLVYAAVVVKIEHKIQTGFCVMAFTKLPAGFVKCNGNEFSDFWF